MNAAYARLGLLAVGVFSVQGCTIDISPGEFSIGLTAGVGLYVFANVMYAKMRLEDEPSTLKRTVAFWLGLPTSFLLFLLLEPDDTWIQRRLDRSTLNDSDDNPEEVQRDFERELQRIRLAAPDPDTPGRTLD